MFAGFAGSNALETANILMIAHLEKFMNLVIFVLLKTGIKKTISGMCEQNL